MFKTLFFKSKSRFLSLLTLFLMALFPVITGCAGLVEHTVNLTALQLQEKLEQRLEMPITVLKIFRVQLSQPVITFNGTTERLHARVNAGVTSIFGGNPLQGTAMISGKLRFDANRQAVLLVESQIESLNIVGLERASEVASFLANDLSAEVLHDVPLYTLKPDDLKFAGIRFKPKSLQVTNDGLKVLLSP
jgi:hypothetical protein